MAKKILLQFVPSETLLCLDYYGGVGFLWKRAIDEYVTIIDCDYDWLFCIEVSTNSMDFYLLNVYMPCECEDNRDVYNDYIHVKTCCFL